MVESIGLENRRTFGYRGFESHPACTFLCDQLWFLFFLPRIQTLLSSSHGTPFLLRFVLVVRLLRLLVVMLKVVLLFDIVEVATNVPIVLWIGLAQRLAIFLLQ